MSTRRLLPFFFTTAAEPRPAGAQLYIIGWSPGEFRAASSLPFSSISWHREERGLLRVSQLVIVLALAAPSVLLAADYFGAIAYSTSTGAHGWSKDHPSRAAAQKAARAACS